MKTLKTRNVIFDAVFITFNGLPPPFWKCFPKKKSFERAKPLMHLLDHFIIVIMTWGEVGGIRRIVLDSQTSNMCFVLQNPLALLIY